VKDVQKKTVLLPSLHLEVDAYRHDRVRVFTEGVVGWLSLRGKRGGSVCSVNIYSDTRWMTTDWLRGIVCVSVCVCVFERETVRQKGRMISMNGCQMSYSDEQIQAFKNRALYIVFGLCVCKYIYICVCVCSHPPKAESPREVEKSCSIGDRPAVPLDKIKFRRVKQGSVLWFNKWPITSGRCHNLRASFALQTRDMQMREGNTAWLHYLLCDMLSLSFSPAFTLAQHVPILLLWILNPHQSS